jgi:hypothetical protein
MDAPICSISHQALSERLRRGHATLIEETLVFETPSATSDHHSVADAARSDDSGGHPAED